MEYYLEASNVWVIERRGEHTRGEKRKCIEVLVCKDLIMVAEPYALDLLKEKNSPLSSLSNVLVNFCLYLFNDYFLFIILYYYYFFYYYYYC